MRFRMVLAFDFAAIVDVVLEIFHGVCHVLHCFTGYVSSATLPWLLVRTNLTFWFSLQSAQRHRGHAEYQTFVSMVSTFACCSRVVH